MNTIDILEKELIKLYKNNLGAASGGVFIKEIYTCLPENPAYPYIRIGSIKKIKDYNLANNLERLEVEIIMCTNDNGNANCIALLNKLEAIDLNKEIQFKNIDDYSLRIGDIKMSLNADDMWQVNLTIYLTYVNFN
jgi:hypothetical protein